MTREQIANIIWTRFDQGNKDWIKCDVAAGWILAALEDEKKGEVILGKGPLCEMSEQLDYCIGCGGMLPIRDNTKGQLIFRPDVLNGLPDVKKEG